MVTASPRYPVMVNHVIFGNCSILGNINSIMVYISIIYIIVKLVKDIIIYNKGKGYILIQAVWALYIFVSTLRKHHFILIPFTNPYNSLNLILLHRK